MALLVSFTIHAQQKFDISGHVKDSSDVPLSYTSVLLLAPADSALIAYTLTSDDGNFQFKNVARQNYLVKATYVSYLPYQELAVAPEVGDLRVPDIVLNPISQQLYEVVVKTAKAPISIKGDTIEYDASKFKVPPGATMEELLRKLPGVQIDKDGNVIAQGEQVRKVTVDGRRFFGNNTKIATQNLNADAVSKVQFFDDKSEQSKLTGVQDGVREKTMNVELKEEAKKGGFGKVTVAAGADGRWNTSGLFNRFDKVNQFSIVGYGNNTNQSGLSWDDRQEFQGSGSFSGFNDLGDFGFNSSGGMRYFYFSGGDSEESFDIPFNNLSKGFSDNEGAGVNYNYLKKKKDFNSSYFFSRSNQLIEGNENRQNFLTDGSSFFTKDLNAQENLAGHHRLNFRFKNEIDSTNTLTIVGKGRYSNLSTSLSSLQELIRSTGEQSSMQRENGTDKYSMAYQGSAIFRHKFKKNGRNFAASLSSTGSKGDLEGTQKAVVDILNSSDPNSYFRNLDQLNSSLNYSQLLKSSLLFVEPLTKVLFLETFYNFSKSTGEITRTVFDSSSDGSDLLNTALSRNFKNDILYNRLGASLRYSVKGNNLSVGLAGAQFNIAGDYAVTPDDPLLGTIEKKYSAITPNFSFFKNMKGNKHLSSSYTMGLTPPSISDLQPFKDISNPLFIREGNPDLLPQVSHNIEASFYKYDPATFIRLYINMNAAINKDQIVQNQSIDPNTLVTTFTAGNVSGGNRIGFYSGFGFPIVKTKLTIDIDYYPSINNSITLINDIENKTKTFSNGINARLTLTPADWISVYSGFNYQISKTEYELNASQNQDIINLGAYFNMNIKLPKEFYIDTKFDYDRFENKRFGFDQKLPILNAFAYKLVGEKKRVELRLSAYDIFNKNQGITQQASQNFVFQRQVTTLARYFLFGVTYNMRGVEVKKRR